jgi:primosomal protein N' (replication factor Y)
MRVRVPLHGRNVAGWVIEIGEPSPGLAANKIRSIIKILGLGTTEEVIELAHWAVTRWAGRIRSFVSASAPSTLIKKVPTPRHLSRSINFSSVVADEINKQAGGLVVVSPLANPTSIVSAFASKGPVIVVIPTAHRAKLLAASLKVNGFSTALWPQDWASAYGGADVVVGTRSVIWAPVAKFSTIVVIDEHDDLLQEERSPSWHARDVAIERCRRAQAVCCLISPIPSQAARNWASNRVFEIKASDDQKAWPKIKILDRNKDESWSSSLISSELIAELRDSSRRVVCVLNTKGRARLIACGKCRTILRCENCDAAVVQSNSKTLECPRCALKRPVVCQSCGSSSCALLKPGVSRMREELQAAAKRTVCEVTSATDEVNQRVNVFVGTEAVLHRVGTADTVVFLDIDAELLAPRYRTSELVATLVVHAARLVGGSKKNPLIMLQTHTPKNVLLVGLATGNFETFNSSERSRRSLLKFPPFGSLAEISGIGTKTFLETMSESVLVQTVVKDSTHGLVRADNWQVLSEVLANTKRPHKSRLSIHVDPPRV